MQPVPHPMNLDHLDGRIVQLTIAVGIPARAVGMAEPLSPQITLANAATHLAQDEPNKAMALLLGAALEASCRADEYQVALAMGAAIHVLKGIAEAQAEGVTV